jgi:hypothetical protein
LLIVQKKHPIAQQESQAIKPFGRIGVILRQFIAPRSAGGGAFSSSRPRFSHRPETRGRLRMARNSASVRSRPPREPIKNFVRRLKADLSRLKEIDHAREKDWRPQKGLAK